MTGLRAFSCAQCGRQAEKASGSVNRSIRKGAPLYCSRTCSGLARRLHKSDATKRAEKSDYDRRYREINREKRAAYNRESYLSRLRDDPDGLRAEQKEHRRKRKDAHAEYCRRPEYRVWKREYDRQYRATKDFGSFAEAALILLDLEAEITSRASRYEIYSANGTLNKALKRKRDYAKAFSG